MKAKRFLTLMLAVLMMATLCIPAAAAARDIPCCGDPWLESPIYGEWELESAYDYHIWKRVVVYFCSHCEGYYEEEDYYEEPHSLEDYIVDGEVVGEWCPECGIIYRPGAH